MNRKALSLFMIFILAASTGIKGQTDWDGDIRYLQEQLPGVHADFGRITDTGKFRRDLDRIREEVPYLEDREIILELQKVLARLHVSHTNIPFQYSERFTGVPVQLELFDDGLFMVQPSAGPLGAPDRRIVRINGVPVEEVLERLENDSLVVSGANRFLGSLARAARLQAQPWGKTRNRA
jgi:hypothetical protein